MVVTFQVDRVKESFVDGLSTVAIVEGLSTLNI
jgi:hypothetical protein